MHKRQSGQSLVEFVLGAAISAVMIGGTGILLHAQWNRFRCAHLVFETTHARLVGRSLQWTAETSWVDFTDTSTSIQGHARCGRAHERVELYKLEAQ